MDGWSIEVVLMVLLDLTSFLQSEPVIERMMSQKKSMVYDSQHIAARRTTQSSGLDAGNDTRGMLSSERSESPNFG